MYAICIFKMWHFIYLVIFKKCVSLIILWISNFIQYSNTAVADSPVEGASRSRG